MHAGKTLRWAGAGATPLLTAYSRPKAPWGRSRPSPNTGDRVLPACIHGCKQTQMRRSNDLE